MPTLDLTGYSIAEIAQALIDSGLAMQVVEAMQETFLTVPVDRYGEDGWYGEPIYDEGEKTYTFKVTGHNLTSNFKVAQAIQYVFGFSLPDALKALSGPFECNMDRTQVLTILPTAAKYGLFLATSPDPLEPIGYRCRAIPRYYPQPVG